MRQGFRVVRFALCCSVLICHSAAALKPSLEIDAAAPNFQATTFDGQKISLADLKGQVVVLNFWATWCGPCKQELPLLEGYYRKQQSAGLKVLAVATEDSLTPAQLMPLAKVLTIPMVKRFKGEYGPIKALPTNFVIDRKGVLRYAQAGGFTLDSLNEILGPLLAQGAE
jgi:cytochrome c biogenesis protein CcmG/thiol:disulfide interchange protein DsbE